MKTAEMGWSGYGDPQYVNHVLRYYNQYKSVSTGKGSFIFPIQSGKFRISSGFGMRTDPLTGGKEFHKGIDLAKRRTFHPPPVGSVLFVPVLLETGLIAVGSSSESPGADKKAAGFKSAA